MKNKPSLPLSRSALAWLTWGLAALFYYYEFALQVSPSVMTTQLASVFQVQAAGLGKLAASYFYAYAFMQIPVGFLLDRFGPRLMLTIALLICALGSFLFSRTISLTTAEWARFLMGMGSAFSVVSCFKIAANWFPPQRFALLTGLLVTIGMLGAAGGEAPLALLVTVSSWRAVLIGFAVVGLVLGVLIWLIVRDYPPDAIVAPPPVDTIPHLGVLHVLSKILRQRQIWLATIYGALMFAPTIAFGDLWAIPYLTTHFAISKTTAGAIMTLFFIGWAVGATGFGAYSDLIKRRKPALYISSIGALITVCLLLYLPNTIPWIMIFLFFFGFFSAGFLPIFSIVKEISSGEYVATALGFTNTLNMLVGGVILQPVIGVLLDHLWSGELLVSGQRYYALQDYTTALSTLPGCLLVALLILPWIRETYCQTKAHSPQAHHPAAP